MSAPVSVVIPTLEAADRIGPCLGALGERNAVREGIGGGGLAETALPGGLQLGQRVSAVHDGMNQTKQV